jgi:predicted HTH domain antitoxin
MEALGLHDVTKMTTTDVVTLGTLAELTGFPVDYIKRELLLEGESLEELTLEELRRRVLAYLDSKF